MKKDNFVINESFFEEDERSSYTKYVEGDDSEEELIKIRQTTYLGHPIRDMVFIDKLSKLLGRELTFREKGRPKKEG